MSTVAPRRVYRTAQIKKDTRHALMDVLADAANALTEKQIEADGWRELAEREPETDERSRFPVLAALAIGIVVGAMLGWLL